MKKDSRQRMYEVMGRLDKTFKPRLDEGFEKIEATDNIDVPAEINSDNEISIEEPVEEKSPEEKLAELTAKVDEIYALIHGENDSEEMANEIPSEEPEEVEIETGEVEPDNLQEWNFDKKKDKKEEETPAEEKEEVDETEETKSKIPVEPIAKVGK